MGGRRPLKWAGHALRTVLVGARPGAEYDVSPSSALGAVAKAWLPLRAPEGDLETAGSYRFCRWESSSPSLPSVDEEDARRRLSRVVGRRPEAGEGA